MHQSNEQDLKRGEKKSLLAQIKEASLYSPSPVFDNAYCFILEAAFSEISTVAHPEYSYKPCE